MPRKRSSRKTPEVGGRADIEQRLIDVMRDGTPAHRSGAWGGGMGV